MGIDKRMPRKTAKQLIESLTLKKLRLLEETTLNPLWRKDIQSQVAQLLEISILMRWKENENRINRFFKYAATIRLNENDAYDFGAQLPKKLI